MTFESDQRIPRPSLDVIKNNNENEHIKVKNKENEKNTKNESRKLRASVSTIALNSSEASSSSNNHKNNSSNNASHPHNLVQEDKNIIKTSSTQKNSGSGSDFPKRRSFIFSPINTIKKPKSEKNENNLEEKLKITIRNNLIQNNDEQTRLNEDENITKLSYHTIPTYRVKIDVGIFIVKVFEKENKRSYQPLDLKAKKALSEILVPQITTFNINNDTFEIEGYCKEGNLQEFLLSEKFSEKQPGEKIKYILKITQEMLRIQKTLDEKLYFFPDFKLSNLMLSGNTDSAENLKLALSDTKTLKDINANPKSPKDKKKQTKKKFTYLDWKNAGITHLLIPEKINEFITIFIEKKLDVSNLSIHTNYLALNFIHLAIRQMFVILFNKNNLNKKLLGDKSLELPIIDFLTGKKDDKIEFTETNDSATMIQTLKELVLAIENTLNQCNEVLEKLKISIKSIDRKELTSGKINIESSFDDCYDEENCFENIGYLLELISNHIEKCNLTLSKPASETPRPNRSTVILSESFFKKEGGDNNERIQNLSDCFLKTRGDSFNLLQEFMPEKESISQKPFSM